jgi:hypothetical protein
LLKFLADALIAGEFIFSYSATNSIPTVRMPFFCSSVIHYVELRADQLYYAVVMLFIAEFDPREVACGDGDTLGELALS